MKKFIFSSMLFGGLMMASCSDDVMEAPVQEDVRKEYAKNFVETFGPISRNVDWNASAIKTITVNGVANADVNVYASVLGTYRLAGVYTGVNSGDKLEFTTYKMVDDIVVTCGGAVVKVENAVANFATSRAFAVSTDKSHFTITQPRTFDGTEINKNLNNTPQGHNNFGTSTTYDFTYLLPTYKNDEPVVIYPIYWEGVHTHKLYIYWEDVNGYHEEYVYTTKDGDGIFTCEDAKSKLFSIAKNKEGVDKSYDVKNGNGTKSIKVTNKGIQVNLPKNQLFGLKLEVYDENSGKLLNTWFTDPAKNNGAVQARYQPAKHKIEGNEAGEYSTLHWEESVAGTDKDNKNETNSDLNDFVLLVTNAECTSSTPQRWVLAIEDLGTTDDYDFNDIILYVEHAKNLKKAAVTVLAAGGTLEAYLQYKGKTVGKEIHAWFADTPANTYPMINTFEEGLHGNTVLVDVEDDFTMALYTDDVENKMGDFTILVNGNNSTMIAPPNKGEVPQIICLPEGWLWPRERVSMNVAYPGFTDYVNYGNPELWGQNYPNQDGWLATKVAEKVMGNISTVQLAF